MSLHFNGQASVSDYESLLLSLTYAHTATEPIPGNRSITFVLSDGIHQDMTAVLVIVVLINDNPLTLQSDTTRLTYSEGDAAIPAGVLSGVTLMDGDRDALVESLEIGLSGVLQSGSEAVVVDTSAVIPGGDLISGSNIVITQTSSLQNYQVI